VALRAGHVTWHDLRAPLGVTVARRVCSGRGGSFKRDIGGVPAALRLPAGYGDGSIRPPSRCRPGGHYCGTVNGSSQTGHKSMARFVRTGCDRYR